MCKEISSTEFINKKIMHGGDISNMVEVRNFALLWNMFELLIISENECKTFTLIEEKSEELVKLSAEDKVEEMFIYLKKRYGEDGRFNINYLFKDNDSSKVKNKIKSLLNSETDGIEDKIYVVFHMIRLIRNNFFHGSKKFYELSRNEDLFKEINLFLISYIEKAYNKKYC